MDGELRLIRKEDYYKGFMNLLSELTRIGEHTYEEFCQQLDKVLMNSVILVIEKDGRIIASGKIFIETKLHNNFACIGHIEDIVVKKEYRKYGYGKIIVERLIKVAKEFNCYKTVLNCNKDLTEFYKKCGFKEKGLEMCIYNN